MIWEAVGDPISKLETPPATLADLERHGADLLLWCRACHHHITLPIADAIARYGAGRIRAVDQGPLRAVRLAGCRCQARLATEGAAGDAALTGGLSPVAVRQRHHQRQDAFHRIGYVARFRGALRRPVAGILGPRLERFGDG